MGRDSATREERPVALPKVMRAPAKSVTYRPSAFLPSVACHEEFPEASVQQVPAALKRQAAIIVGKRGLLIEMDWDLASCRDPGSLEGRSQRLPARYQKRDADKQTVDDRCDHAQPETCVQPCVSRRHHATLDDRRPAADTSCRQPLQPMPGPRSTDGTAAGPTERRTFFYRRAARRAEHSALPRNYLVQLGTLTCCASYRLGVEGSISGSVTLRVIKVAGPLGALRVRGGYRAED